MADIVANFLTDGVNTAYTMNAIKVENGKLILYNASNPDINNGHNSVTLAELALASNTSGESSDDDGFNAGARGIYYIESDNNTESDNLNNNDTEMLQNIIDGVSSDLGGGTIYLSAGIWYVNGLTLKPRVRLVGAGQGNTIIQRSNYQGTMNNDIKDSISSHTSFIVIPKYATDCSIEDLTIRGTVKAGSNDLDPVDMSSEPYTVLDATALKNSNGDTIIINGVAVQDILNSASDCENKDNQKISPYGVAYNYIETGTNNGVLEEGGVCKLKNFLMRNVSVIGFTGIGVYVGTNNERVTLDNVESSLNYNIGFGISCNGANITNCTANGNGTTGFRIDGYSNKLTNITARFNGCIKDVSSGNPLSSTSAVILEGGARHVIANAYIANNYYHGLTIKANRSVCHGLILSSNGVFKTVEVNADTEDALYSKELSVGANQCIVSGTISYDVTQVGIPILLGDSTNYVSGNVLNITYAANTSSNMKYPQCNGANIIKSCSNKIVSGNVLTLVGSADSNELAWES